MAQAVDRDKSTRSRTRRLRAVGVLVAGPVLGLPGMAWAGGFGAGVANLGGTLQSASEVLQAAQAGSPICGLEAGEALTQANAVSCSASIAPTGPLPPAGQVASVTTSVAQEGSAPSSSSVLEASACGVVQFADASDGSDPLLARGEAISLDQPGPLGGSGSASLSGASAYGADLSGTSGVGPAGFSVAAWFKSSSTAGGTIMAFVSTPNDYAPERGDYALWLDPAGHVVFGVYHPLLGGLATEATSAQTYSDGAWHLAVGSYSAGVLGTVSVQVGLAAPVQALMVGTPPSPGSGYWHLGWGYYQRWASPGPSGARGGGGGRGAGPGRGPAQSSWADPPSDPYLAGQVADAAVFSGPLSAQQVAGLAQSGSQAAWEQAIARDGAIRSWAMSDDGSVLYEGAVPEVSPLPCDFADMAVLGPGGCVVPAVAGPCPAGGVPLASLAGQSYSVGSGPDPGHPIDLSVSVGRDPTDTVSAYPYAAGLHLCQPLSVVSFDSGFSSTLGFMDCDLEL